MMLERWSLRALQCLTVAMSASVLLACGDGDAVGSTTVTSAEQLAVALRNSRPGDNIELGTGTFTGSFSVPAGVTLDGAGATIFGDTELALELEGGGEVATRLKNINVTGEGSGVVAREGVVVLEDVTINVDRGKALLVSNAAHAELTRVAVTGPVSEETVEQVGGSIDAESFAALGIGIVGGEVQLKDLSVSGFAGFGVILRGVSGHWRGGTVFENVGTSVLAEQSDVSLESVDIRDGYNSAEAGDLSTSTGLIISSSSSVATKGLVIDGMSGAGILQDHATSEHADLKVSRSGAAGVWVQNQDDASEVGTALSIVGESALLNNRGNGVHLKSIRSALFDGVLISGTTKLTRVDGVKGVDIADGVQAIDVTEKLSFFNTVLAANERVGFLFDGRDGEEGEASPEFEVDEWSITGAGDYGLILQATRAEVTPTQIDPTLAAKDLQAREIALILATDPFEPSFPGSNLAIGDDVQSGP
jgi:hypothetical protein